MYTQLILCDMHSLQNSDIPMEKKNRGSKLVKYHSCGVDEKVLKTGRGGYARIPKRGIKTQKGHEEIE